MYIGSQVEMRSIEAFRAWIAISYINHGYTEEQRKTRRVEMNDIFLTHWSPRSIAGATLAEREEGLPRGWR
jgi:hypothetical protein